MFIIIIIIIIIRVKAPFACGVLRGPAKGRLHGVVNPSRAQHVQAINRNRGDKKSSPAAQGSVTSTSCWNRYLWPEIGLRQF